MRRDVAVGLALPPALATGAFLTYAAVGNLDEDAGYMVMQSLPQGRTGPAVLGALSLAALISHLVVRWRSISLPREAWYLLALSLGTGIGLGGTLRVISAMTVGANIGGGMLLYFVTPIGLIIVGLFTWRWWAALPDG